MSFEKLKKFSEVFIHLQLSFSNRLPHKITILLLNLVPNVSNSLWAPQLSNFDFLMLTKTVPQNYFQLDGQTSLSVPFPRKTKRQFAKNWEEEIGSEHVVLTCSGFCRLPRKSESKVSYAYFTGDSFGVASFLCGESFVVCFPLGSPIVLRLLHFSAGGGKRFWEDHFAERVPFCKWLVEPIGAIVMIWKPELRNCGFALYFIFAINFWIFESYFKFF